MLVRGRGRSTCSPTRPARPPARRGRLRLARVGIEEQQERGLPPAGAGTAQPATARAAAGTPPAVGARTGERTTAPPAAVAAVARTMPAATDGRVALARVSRSATA